MVDRSSAQATALPRLGLRSPPLAELAKREAHSDRERPKRLASVKGEAMLPMLQESPLVEAMQLFWKVARLGVVNRRLLEDSDLPLLATLQANPLARWWRRCSCFGSRCTWGWRTGVCRRTWTCARRSCAWRWCAARRRGRGCRTCRSGGRSVFLFCQRARANIREILAHTHFPEEYRSLKNVIARCAAAAAPFPLDVVGRVIGANLLAVTIDAAVRSINARAPFDHSGLRLRISVAAILFHLRIEMSNLPIRDDRQSHPREGERSENSEKERGESFHKCASGPSASTGFRNVGTVDVRPNPKSISPK